MDYDAIGWANRYVSGAWSEVFTTEVAATRDAQVKAADVDRRNIAVRVFRERPTAPPRPSVRLIRGDVVVTFRTDTNRWVGTYPSGAAPEMTDIVMALRNLPVSDDEEIDAVQALPALTRAWEAENP